MPGSVKPARPGDETVWRVRVSLGRDPRTGSWQTIQRTVHGTRRQAELVAGRLAADAKDRKLTRHDCTVTALLDRYVAHVEDRGRAPRTVHSYELMATWIKHEIGRRQVSSLTGPELDSLTTRIAKEKGQSSADHYYRFLRASMRQAERWGLIDKAPTDRATAPGAPGPRTTAPGSEMVRALIAEAEKVDQDLASLLYVAATTGMRRGELCALQVGDVDLEDAYLVVRRAVSIVSGEVHVRTTKTGKVRRVSLDPSAVVVLDRQARKVARDRALIGLPPDADAYLWSRDGEHEQPKPPDSVTAAFNRLRDRLGFAGLHMHDIRHFAATQMLAAGIDPVTAAARLGHSPALMQRTYAHAIESRDREAAAILGRALAPLEK